MNKSPENAYTYDIVSIRDKFHLLDQVIALGDSQKKTLGFLPEGAFHDYAQRGWIVVAADVNEKVIGYLAYRQTRGLECRLVHLCVLPEYRNKGIAGELVRKFKLSVRHLLKIKLKCRRDYGLDSFWQHNGFVPKGEVRGRAHNDTTLTIWECLLHPTLLSLPHSSEKPLAILDVNVIIGAHIENDLESSALLSEISFDEVEYRVSDCSFFEANKCTLTELRAQTLAQLNAYSFIPACSDQQIISEATHILGEKNGADIHQVASAVYAGAECFITKDLRIISKAEELRKKFSIHIYTPTEFLINISDGIGKGLYSPHFTPYSDINFLPFEDFEEKSLYQLYGQPSEEKNLFRDKLVAFIQPKKSNSAYRIIAGNREIGICFQTIEDGKLFLHLIRLAKSLKHKHTVGIHVIENVLRSALDLGVEVIFCKDSDCGRVVESALLGAHFRQTETGFVKVVSKGFLSTSTAIEKIQVHSGIQIPSEDLPACVLLDLENQIWPAKLLSLTLPVYLIPIQPRWAQRLISPQGFQGLLVDRPSVMTQTQRVYYRSRRGIPIEVPSRLVWYVSNGKKRTLGKCALGVSLVDDIEIAPVKKLYSKYERLGVYAWNDIYQKANRNPQKEMMAILFSKTEIFKRLISYNQLASLIEKHEAKNISIVSPFRISQSSFEDIYTYGFGNV